jgi:fibronectin type 3 domain-containing protein
LRALIDRGDVMSEPTSRRFFSAVVLTTVLALQAACTSGSPPSPVPVVPPAPTGLTATAGDGQVTLTWNAVAGATSYVLYWSNSIGVGKSTGIRISSVSFPYVHRNLTNGTPYFYVVTAANGSGEGDASAEASATPAPVVPSAPTGLTATAGDGQITLTWNAVAGATSYALYWSNSTGVGKSTGTRIPGVSSPYVHRSLTNGTPYFYVVTAANESGEGDASAEASATPIPVVPPAPTGLTATAGDGQVTLAWNPVAGATSYVLYWSTSTGVGKSTGTRIASVSSPYVHRSLTNGASYFYVVTAANESGEGDASAEASATPAALTAVLSITLGTVNQSQGLTLLSGGDADTVAVSAGSPVVEARATGNGVALPSVDQNRIPDFYLQIDVDDSRILAGSPPSRVQLEVDYLDEGTDVFAVEYDGTPSASGTGKFTSAGRVAKTNSRAFRTAVFTICDPYFANRDNGADFRISDEGDGPEVIHAIRMRIEAAGARSLRVDDSGANPFDDSPDGAAIQAVLDSTCSGDTVVFTSPAGSSSYRGYGIDRTLFLTGTSPKTNLTFTSSNPADHALLRATADLKGFVVRLFARSRFADAGPIRDIDFGYIDVDGNRAERRCSGPDGIPDGNGDNWGSWLPECSAPRDSWCSPGNIAMEGAIDQSNLSQDYVGNPSAWTTGIVVHDLVDRNTECATALAFGGAAGTIRNVVVDTAGDHVHVGGCAHSDPDGEPGDWSDGMTIVGPGHTISGNTVIDPSDIGIVSFGGKGTVISGNTIRITAGNHGAFSGIALHDWAFGDSSGIRIVGNTVLSEGDTSCGGVHVGIDVGPHMWGGGCVTSSVPSAVGNSTCSPEPVPPSGSPCGGGACQVWNWVPAGGLFSLQGNDVTGTHINYLVEGLDVAGTLDESGNASHAPRRSDWESLGCASVSTPLDKVAHHPSLAGWTDLRIHCER